MKYVLFLIIEAHLYIICIVLVSYILEKVTNLKLLVDNFRWEKSDYMAKGAAGFQSTLYFLASMCVLLYHVYIKGDAPEEFAFWKWLIIMAPLTILFRVLQYQFQVKDPTREGIHYD
jgi:hypothetical protein